MLCTIGADCYEPTIIIAIRVTGVLCKCEKWYTKKAGYSYIF